MKTNKRKPVKRASRYATSDGHSYLTKRTTVRKARAAGKVAATNAMQVMGFVVVAENGTVVKKFPDGRKEIIAQI